MKRTYPIRPQIYLPVARFGVVLSDWPGVLIPTALATFIPLFGEFKAFGFPVYPISGPLVFFPLVWFFNRVRTGKPPFWLQHKFRSLVSPRRLGAVLPSHPPPATIRVRVNLDSLATEDDA
jgi:hypothetical protein